MHCIRIHILYIIYVCMYVYEGMRVCVRESEREREREKERERVRVCVLVNVCVVQRKISSQI